jgi:uncharacterized membrane protein YbhN (UPF0104 family)
MNLLVNQGPNDMDTASAKSDRVNPLSAQIARRTIIVLLLTAAIGSLLLAVPGLQGVARQMEHLNAAWVIGAVALELGSCIGFVVIFRLFFDEVPAGPARELGWTEQGAGALLPGGGAGALALGGWLLKRHGVSTRRVIERSSALFFLTSATNVAALIGAGALLAAGLVAGPHDLVRTGIPIVGGLVALVAVLLVPVLARRSPRRRRATWLTDIVEGIDGARDTLFRPSWRLIGALGYLALDVAALGASFAATGHALPIAPLVLGYLLGDRANLIPVPGGFGVLEGGLAGALIAYGAPATQAAAAVVVYHAIAFWIPSLGGVLGYALLQRRQRSGSARRSLDGSREFGVRDLGLARPQLVTQ